MPLSFVFGIPPLGYAIGAAPPRRVPYPQTPATSAAWIKAHGVAVAELARQHQLPRLVLVDLLRGKLRGHRGLAHQGAIVLGLKPEPKGGACSDLRRPQRLQSAAGAAPAAARARAARIHIALARVACIWRSTASCERSACASSRAGLPPSAWASFAYACR